MKLYAQFPLELAQEIAATLELELANIRVHKTYVEFKLNPPHSRHRYARTTAKGHALKACSYEAFRDFIALAFRKGATKVQSTLGTWNSYQAFQNDLSRLAHINVGSQAFPVYMRDLSNEKVAPI
jgi:hypothetical protein